MIVIDANILLYAYDELSAQHAEARKWIQRTFSGPDPVGLPWQSIAAFLRINTHKNLPGPRYTVEEATQIVDSWLDQPNVRVLLPSDDYWILLRRIMIDGQASGVLVSDAEIAALTASSGGVLYTTDRDFARFPGLRWKNPLQ